ncbi:MAG: RHS repeat-associated core domain-containing protein, partial [Bacteroidota bacterium]
NDIRDQDPGNYQYNAKGQLVHDVSKEEYYTYNDRGQLTGVYGNDQLGDTKAEFQYDERGHRLSKLIYDGSGNLLNTYWYVRDGNGRVMSIFHEPAGPAAQVMESAVYGSDRVGVYDPAYDQYHYELNDQLGNVRAVVERVTGGSTAVVARITDYYPFGHPMPGRQYATAVTYRHGYQGEFTEWDAILGLTAFEARHWDGRLGRWTNPDPVRQYDSPYVGMGNNPITMIDPDGRAAFGLAAIKIAKIIKVIKPFIKPAIHAGLGNLFENRASILDDDGFGKNLLQGAGFFAVGAAEGVADKLGVNGVFQAALKGTLNALIDGKGFGESLQLGHISAGSFLIAETVTKDLLGGSFKKFGKKGDGAELLSDGLAGFTKGFTKEFSKGLLKGFVKGKFEEGELDKILKKSLIAGGYKSLGKLGKNDLGKEFLKSGTFQSAILTVGPPIALYGLHVFVAEQPSKDDLLNFVKDVLFVIDEKKEK